MKYYTSLFKGIIEKRKLIWDLSKADFKKRFVGSYFGVIWMFIQPLVTILIYAFLFGEYGFKSRRLFRERPMSSGWFRESCPGSTSARR